MIELCKINRLKVVRDTPQGLYLEEPSQESKGSENSVNGAAKNKESVMSEKRAPAAKFTGKREDVLLPRPEVLKHISIGDEIDVFIYLDSSDRYTATLKMPLICMGALSCLKIAQVTDIGIFLDWGLEKNLLLPFKELVMPFFYDPLERKEYSRESIEGRNGADRLGKKDIAWLEQGRLLPVMLYIDKSGRPAATMRIYNQLSVGERFVTDSAVEATVIRINPELGVFVAVDDKYFGMINIKEITDMVNVGDRIFGRISGVRDDGKYMVSLTQKAHLQMDNDAQVILKRLRSAGGTLPLGDKSNPKDIMKELGMSKKAFKRAVGQLYKEKRVIPGDSEIREA